MSVTKPARWAVSPGMVDPKWRWAWQGLRLLFPLWDLNVDQAGLLGPVETNDWPGDHTLRITKVGLGIALTNPDATYSTRIGTPNFSEDYNYWSDPWSACVLFNVSVQPTSDQMEIFSWEGMSTARFNQGTTIGLEYLGASMDADVQFGSGWPVPEWVLFCARSQGGDGTTNSVKLDAFVLETGEHLWDTSAGWNYTGTGGRRIDFFRTGTVNTVGELEFGIGMFWYRYLSDSEAQRLASDPFGPIRPADSFSRDATWQDLNPTLRAIPGAADGP